MTDPPPIPASPASPPSILVVMGVSGSGKTTIGLLLAHELGWDFADGDSFHPPANVSKMSAGIPLTDDDRWPWLHAIAQWIDAARSAGRPSVVACSALKRSYRRVLTEARDDVRIVYLKANDEIVRQRMATRHGHFMPVTLVQSQYEALEEPGPDEHPIVVSVDATPNAIVDAILRELHLQRPS